MRRLNCLRCGESMAFLMKDKFQKGDMGVFVGDVNFSMKGGFEMEVYSCPRCGKLEFYLPGVSQQDCDAPDMEIDELPPEVDQNIVGVSMDGIPQVRCPGCGRKHDFDYPQCPRCGFRY